MSMGWIPDVVPDEPVESVWGNEIRDRTSTPFPNVAARDAAIPIPQFGQVVFIQEPIPLEYWWDGSKWLGTERLVDRVALSGVGPFSIVAPGSGSCPAGFAWRVDVQGEAHGRGTGGLAIVTLTRSAPSTGDVSGCRFQIGGAGWIETISIIGVDVPNVSAASALPTYTITNASPPASVPFDIYGFAYLYALGPIPTVAQSLAGLDVLDTRDEEIPNA